MRVEGVVTLARIPIPVWAMTTGVLISSVRPPRDLRADSRSFAMMYAQDPNLLGDNLLAWLVLAIGGALFAGTAMALFRPPAETKEGQLARAPLGRSIVQMVIGFVASAWALATLLV